MVHTRGHGRAGEHGRVAEGVGGERVTVLRGARRKTRRRDREREERGREGESGVYSTRGRAVIATVTT